MWVYLRVDEPIQHLCFTANTANSTVELNKTWSPTAVTLQVSTDWNNWSNYIPWSWTAIQLQNIWDKVYFRNTSETTTWFSIAGNHYYQFSMTWSVAASWDITSLINKNLTSDELSDYCFAWLFESATSLTTSPKLPSTSLWNSSYINMFRLCSWLTTLPELPATTLKTQCYANMFYWCTSIMLSTTQTWNYQTPYRIPSEWTWTAWNNSLTNMFTSTWWTFTWTPTINTTYYTSNTVV